MPNPTLEQLISELTSKLQLLITELEKIEKILLDYIYTGGTRR